MCASDRTFFTFFVAIVAHTISLFQCFGGLRKDEPLSEEDIAVVCMVGFEYFRKLTVDLNFEAVSAEVSVEHRGVMTLCARLGFPLNLGKQLVLGLFAPVL